MGTKVDEMGIKEEAGKTTRSMKKRLINKARRNSKRGQKHLAKMYDSIQKDGSGLGSFLSANSQQINEFEMRNLISTGHSRKLKKKLKKLQKKNPDEGSKEKIFNAMTKFKQSIMRNQEKVIFNPVSELEKRREKRMKKMEVNAKKGKREIIHKKISV